LKFLISIVNAELFETVYFKRLKSTINNAQLHTLLNLKKLGHTVEFNITTVIMQCSITPTYHIAYGLLGNYPKFSTEYGKISLSYLATTGWNALPVPLDMTDFPPPLSNAI